MRSGGTDALMPCQACVPRNDCAICPASHPIRCVGICCAITGLAQLSEYIFFVTIDTVVPMTQLPGIPGIVRSSQQNVARERQHHDLDWATACGLCIRILNSLAVQSLQGVGG